jgi:hypothetical protein
MRSVFAQRSMIGMRPKQEKAPRIDRCNAEPCAGFDCFAQVPLLTHRRKIDGEA